jgi:hypothetical protein
VTTRSRRGSRCSRALTAPGCHRRPDSCCSRALRHAPAGRLDRAEECLRAADALRSGATPAAAGEAAFGKDPSLLDEAFLVYVAGLR